MLVMVEVKMKRRESETKSCFNGEIIMTEV